MKIIDIIVKSLCYIAKDKGIRNLYAAITITNLFLSFNEEALFNLFIGTYIKNMGFAIFYIDSAIPIVALEVISGGFILYFTLRALDREYLNKQGYTRILNTHVPKALGILILIVYYFATIFLFFYSLSFLPYKPLNV